MDIIYPGLNGSFADVVNLIQLTKINYLDTYNMKKFRNLLLGAILSLGLFTVSQAQISVGGGLAYGLDIEELGIQASGTYVLNEDMRLGADIIYWLTPSESFPGGVEFSTTMFEINANYNYIFYNENDVMFYALGTLGIHYAKVSWDGPSGSEWSGRASGSDTELGLGIGAGVEYNLGSIKLYAEPRLFLSGFEQFSLAAGLRIPIN